MTSLKSNERRRQKSSKTEDRTTAMERNDDLRVKLCPGGIFGVLLVGDLGVNGADSRVNKFQRPKTSAEAGGGR